MSPGSPGMVVVVFVVVVVLPLEVVVVLVVVGLIDDVIGSFLIMYKFTFVAKPSSSGKKNLKF